MADRIQYDADGNARPVLNLADTALRFDGDWDAELRALDAPPGSPPVSMRQWLIEPTTNDSKLEGLQEAGPMFIKGQWDGVPPLYGCLPTVGERRTSEYRSPLRWHTARRVLQWLGFPVATEWVTRCASVCTRVDHVASVNDVLRSSGEWNRQPDGSWLCIEFRADGQPLCIPEAAHTDWPRLRRCALTAAFTLVWATNAYLFLRSLHRG